MKPYYQDSAVTIYHGDCREILPELPKVDLVLTDPPYGVDAASWDGEVPYEMLTSFLQLSLGAVIWFGAATKIGEALRKFQPEPRVLVWCPSFSLLKTMANGVAYRWHPIYAWRIPDEHDGPTWDSINDNTECGNWWNHHCTKPISLIKKLCGFCAVGNVVLDPFMGSGTTPRAAKDLGRKAIGIEIEEKYCEIAARRMEQEVLDLQPAKESVAVHAEFAL